MAFTIEHFESKRNERTELDTPAKPFRDLSPKTVYEVTETKHLNTKHGDTHIIKIADDWFWTPSTFKNKVAERNVDISKPFQLAYFGMVKTKAGHPCHDYDLE